MISCPHELTFSTYLTVIELITKLARHTMTFKRQLNEQEVLLVYQPRKIFIKVIHTTSLLTIRVYEVVYWFFLSGFNVK